MFVKLVALALIGSASAIRHRTRLHTKIECLYNEYHSLSGTVCIACPEGEVANSTGDGCMTTAALDAATAAVVCEWNESKDEFGGCTACGEGMAANSTGDGCITFEELDAATAVAE